jgi:hypothetical protein
MINHRIDGIISSHGGIHVHGGLLGCNAMWACRGVPMFWKNILSPSLLPLTLLRMDGPIGSGIL